MKNMSDKDLEFIDYVHGFYGNDGIFPIEDLEISELVVACLFAIEATKGHDTFAREIARDYIFYRRGIKKTEYNIFTILERVEKKKAK